MYVVYSKSSNQHGGYFHPFSALTPQISRRPWLSVEHQRRSRNSLVVGERCSISHCTWWCDDSPSYQPILEKCHQTLEVSACSYKA